MTGAFGEAAQALLAEIGEIERTDPTIISVDDDPVYERFQELFDNRICPPPSARQIQDRVANFMEYRCPNQIPPGYDDASKVGTSGPLAAAGDYLIWEELLALGQKHARPVLFITNERSSDWWHLSAKRELIHPHPDLVDEFTAATSQAYFQLSMHDFMTRATSLYKLDIDKTDLDAENQVQKYDDVSLNEVTLVTLSAAEQLAAYKDLIEAATTNHFTIPTELAHVAQAAAAANAPYRHMAQTIAAANAPFQQIDTLYGPGSAYYNYFETVRRTQNIVTGATSQRLSQAARDALTHTAPNPIDVDEKETEEAQEARVEEDNGQEDQAQTPPQNA